MVTALAAAEDGSRLASADAAGHLSLWDLQGRLATKRTRAGVYLLAFSRDGRTLVSGTAKNPRDNRAVCPRPGTWPIRRGGKSRRADIACPDDVNACGLSRDGKYLGLYQWQRRGGESVRGSGESRLSAAVRSPLRVAFPRTGRSTASRWARASQKGRVPLEQTFDTSKVQLGTAARVDESKWISSDWCQLGWDVQTLRNFADGCGNVSPDAARESPRALIPLDPSLHGAGVPGVGFPHVRVSHSLSLSGRVVTTTSMCFA